MDDNDDMVEAMIANAGYVTITPKLEWQTAVSRVENIIENAARQMEMSSAPEEAKKLRQAWMRILEG